MDAWTPPLPTSFQQEATSSPRPAHRLQHSSKPVAATIHCHGLGARGYLPCPAGAELRKMLQSVTYKKELIILSLLDPVEDLFLDMVRELCVCVSVCVLSLPILHLVNIDGGHSFQSP